MPPPAVLPPWELVLVVSGAPVPVPERVVADPVLVEPVLVDPAACLLELVLSGAALVVGALEAGAAVPGDVADAVEW